MKYVDKYSIFSSKNDVNFICDDIEWYRDTYDPPKSGKWYVYIVGEKFIKSDSWNWGDVFLIYDCAWGNCIYECSQNFPSW